MARSIASATSQYLQNNNAVVSAYPFTMACWFNPLDNVTTGVLMGLTDNTTTQGRHRMLCSGAVALDPLQIFSQANSAQTTTSFSAGVWQHACGVWASNTSRTIYLDGGGSAANTSNTAIGSVNTTTIGRHSTSSPGVHFNGRVAEAAVWSVALTADDIALLAKAYSPLLVRPDALVAYWPLAGLYSPEIDVVGGFDMTVTGATKGEHCRVFMPKRRSLRWLAPVAAGGHPAMRRMGLSRYARPLELGRVGARVI